MRILEKIMKVIKTKRVRAKNIINNRKKKAKPHKVRNNQSNNKTETSRKDSNSYVLKVPKNFKEPFLQLPFEK